MSAIPCTAVVSELCVDTAASLFVTSVAIAALRSVVVVSADVSAIPCTPVVSELCVVISAVVASAEVSAIPCT